VVLEARKLCRSVMDAVNEVILIFDPRSFRILDANKRAVQVYGYSRREMVRKEMRDLTHEVPNYSDLVRSAKSVERTDFTKTGERIEFLVSLSLIDYWGHKAVLSINRDIGERKRIEGAIAANEKKLRLLVLGISEIVALIDPQGCITFVSPQEERTLEFPVHDLLGKSIFEFIHPEDRERAMAEYAETIQTPGEGIPSALRLRSRSGEWIPFEVIANNQLHDPDVASVIFTARDLRFRRETEATIHESNVDFDKHVEERALDLAKANAALRLENQQRRHTETQLQHSLSLLYSTLESTADGILVVSREGLITSCNQKFLEMWRIPLMAVVGLRDEVLLSMAAPQVHDTRGFQQGVRFLYGKPDAVRFDTLRLKDGRIFQRYTQPQRVGDETVGRVWSFRDITQPYLLEEELRHAQKMEAIGRLAGGVAHDFNNLLMLISGYAGQILEYPELPTAHKDSVEQLLEATRRAATLTRQLLSFSRKQPLALQRVDLNTLASGMQKMLSRLLSERIEFVLHLQPDPLPIYADPSQIELMIMNLVLNARDAMPDGGRLTITTRAESLPGSVEKYQESLPFDFACLEVADNGHGMGPEVKEHIFEPFFTTKEVGKGTGLGLSTAYGIVDQAGGHISVDSVPKRGTTFRVFLPIAGEGPQDRKKKPARAGAVIVSSPATPALAHHDETILLVEDEAGIRAMTRTYLESEGYRVLGAADGDEAIRVANHYPGSIDLILTDIIMPGMRGNDLVRAIRESRPSVRAIYITGFAEAELDVDATVVEKPFAFADLGKSIREVLDEARKEEPSTRKSA
jgi:two-component system cell cycle sensor histidine kinase/response regulator CckA